MYHHVVPRCLGIVYIDPQDPSYYHKSWYGGGCQLLGKGFLRRSLWNGAFLVLRNSSRLLMICSLASFRRTSSTLLFAKWGLLILAGLSSASCVNRVSPCVSWTRRCIRAMLVTSGGPRLGGCIRAMHVCSKRFVTSGSSCLIIRRGIMWLGFREFLNKLLAFLRLQVP